jgi:hypothetical protein
VDKYDHLQPLSGRELQNVVERQWVQLQLDSAMDQGMDAAVLNAIARVTEGNFRLIQRLFAQIDRVLAINGLATVTTDVVDAARESLVVSALSNEGDLAVALDAISARLAAWLVPFEHHPPRCSSNSLGYTPATTGGPSGQRPESTFSITCGDGFAALPE